MAAHHMAIPNTRSTHTHRAAAMRYTDGAMEVIEEDLGKLRHPRARFTKPVQLAIFMFGQNNAEAEVTPSPKRPRPDPSPGNQDPQQFQPQELHPSHAQEDDPLRLVRKDDDEITFPPELKLTAEIKLAVKRMHKNLGHPRAAELKKLLALNGVSNQAIYSAVEGMKCNSCERTKGPARPDPGGGLPDQTASQFGDRLQMDIIYVRDVKGTNFLVLGIIDEVTHLHVGTLLANRTPEEVTKKFMLAWARPFGFPLRLRTDPDGSFRSTFEDAMDEAGVYVDYIPAEAHNKIGLVERHNATYRSLMERIVDAQGVIGYDQMDIVTAMASHAKNSCTWSTGRPPYVAAFGRIPRQGLELLSDPHGLITGQSRSQAQQFADTIRAEAQQQLAAMSIDSTLRRALLRNTTPGPSDIPEIGSTVAYWRWTARSGKKRGGYKLARLLGRDPDGKSLWLQAGTNTIRVAPHQLRTARGFECWNPDYEQIKQLRAAADNLQHGILQDETIPEPPEDPEQPLGHDQLEAVPDLPAPDIPYLVPPSEPATAAADQAEEAVQTDPYEPHPQSTSVEYHLNVHSPTYNKTVIQSQHSFGMTPEQWMQPPVNAPVRKQHRSRTPASRTPRSIRGQPTTPAVGDAAGQAAAPTPAQPLLPPQEQADQPSAHTPGLPSVMPEVIDIEAMPDTQDPALGSIVPTTPPELAGDTPSNKRASTEMEQPIPSQPSYKALLQQHTKQQQIDQDTYHLHGYKNMAKAADHTLQVWARRDTAAQVLQTTHFCGPPKWSIKHRRVLTYPEGKLLWDAPYSDDQQGHHLFPQRTDTITELWHDNHTDYNNLVVTTDGIQQQEAHHDGTEHIHMPYSCRVAFKAYRASPEYAGDGQSSDSDASADDMSAGQPTLSKAGNGKVNRALTRQEQKALDKEVPWQAIMEMEPHIIQEYVKSAQAEESSWNQFNSVIPLSDEEAKQVFKDPVLAKRILKARAAYRDKAKGQGPIKAKCRVVALGHLDPDLRELSRESATPTRQAEYMIYAFFTCGVNHMLLDGSDSWHLWCGDIKTAFLQGTPEPRKLPLFLRPPQDGVTSLAGTFRAPLYKIVGNIYGLASAPRTWTMHVVKTLVNQAGFQQHTLDKMLFFKYSKLPGDQHESLVAILVAYVDDFLLCHNQRWNRAELTDLFKWGTQETLSVTNSLTFKGKEIHLRHDGKQYYVSLTQSSFIAGMQVGNVRCKGRLEETLKPEDLPEYRSVAGCLQWLAGQTRPDIASTVSLCSKGAKSTYQDLQNMYNAVQHLHQSSEVGINMWPVALNAHTLVVSFQTAVGRTQLDQPHSMAH